MAYSELIKNFEKIRAYMREFYVYGFKSRVEYDSKSARSYDDERRRLDSWLGDYLRFTQTPHGKTVFLSVDSRAIHRNPFYSALKAKSFTPGDLTLHFALFDILFTPSVKLTLPELVDRIDSLLSSRLVFDESTLRKKLREYVSEGIILTEKSGRRLLYSRAPDVDFSSLSDLLDFFSEAAPCGVVGSFLLDKLPPHRDIFSFKHHYITSAIDSEVLASLFSAIHEHRCITVDNFGRRSSPTTLSLVPLRVYISAQNGRQHLLAFHEKANRLNSYRIDFLSSVRIGEVCEKFDALRAALEKAETCMWGVIGRWNPKRAEHVEFELRIDPEEDYVLRRLEREKRCGRVERIDETHYRFLADVFDTSEMIPWIRTFLCRITRLNFSNRTVENRFKADLEEMYRLYGLPESSPLA